MAVADSGVAGGPVVCGALATLVPSIAPRKILGMEEASSSSPGRKNRIAFVNGLPRWFLPFWWTGMPVPSFLLIPRIQGTIPAYLLAFASAGLVLVSGETGHFEL